MSETALATRAPHQAPDVMTLGTVFTKSGYFQDVRDASQAVVKMLAGQELGFGPMASMTGIYIVKGRVTLSANLLAAAVKRGGKYNYRVVELSEAACKIDFYEGKEKIGESSFSMEDAKAAGLVNDQYKKFARNMLFARAMSNGAKWYCADVFGGPVYTPDELGATIDMETGEMLARPADEKVSYQAPPPEQQGGEAGGTVAEPMPDAKPVCPSCGKAAIIESRPEWGGGYVCYRKRGGCGMKYANLADLTAAGNGTAFDKQNAGDAEALFPLGGEVETEPVSDAVLLASVSGRLDAVVRSEVVRKKMWSQYCEGTDYLTMPAVDGPKKLRALLDSLGGGAK